MKSPLFVLAISLVFVSLFGCGPNPAAPPSPAPTSSSAPAPDSAAPTGWPTEEEAKAAMLKVEYAIRASQTNKDVWHVQDLKLEVHSVKFAPQPAEKQMEYGKAAATVYPARVVYTRITEYTDKAATREEEKGVWYFYRDSFGEWTGKYSAE